MQWPDLKFPLLNLWSLPFYEGNNMSEYKFNIGKIEQLTYNKTIDNSKFDMIHDSGTLLRLIGNYFGNTPFEFRL